ncbi:hypothetical protein C8R44DRAFT_750461 [Mycena epipterygia]|nr:hypothetical protein C8R44DRAFT_750461 [Mycena epipterygia]
MSLMRRNDSAKGSTTDKVMHSFQSLKQWKDRLEWAYCIISINSTGGVTRDTLNIFDPSTWAELDRDNRKKFENYSKPCPVLQDEIAEEERGCGGDKERADFAADQDPITDDPTMIAISRSSLQTKVLNIGDRRIRAHEIQILDGRGHDHPGRSILFDLEALIIALGSARAGGHPEFQIPPHPALVGA